MLLTAWGLSIVRSQQEFGWLPAVVRAGASPYLPNSDAVMVGGPVALIGAALAGWAGCRVLPDQLAPLVLSHLRLRWDRQALGALGLAVIFHALLYQRLARGAYGHLDILLFGSGLLLIGYAVHRLDSSKPSTGLPFTRGDGVVAVFLALFALVVNSVELTRWDFGWIGDEGAFFQAGRVVAEGGPWNFFNLAWVYQTHPTLDSVLLGLGMKVFGVNVFGWRFTEVLVVGGATALTYLLGRALFGGLAAVAAAVLLASSHYLMAFTRIGYNNLHMLVYATLAMLMLALAWRTQRAVFFFSTGVAVGFGLYTFQAALLTGPIIALVLLISFLRRPRWSLVAAGCLMLLGFGLVVTPGLLTTPPSEVLQLTLFHTRREMAATDPGYVALAGLVQSPLAFWANHQWHHHYVGGALLDAMSGWLLVVGIAIALFRFHKPAERIALLWFAVGLLVISVSNYLPGPSFTRLLYLVPPAALLAGIAVSGMERVLRASFHLPRLVAMASVALLLALVPPLNLYQLLVDSPGHLSQNRSMLILKALQEHPMQVIVHVGRERDADQNIATMVSWYPWLAGRYRYISEEQLPHLDPSAEGANPPIYLVDSEAPPLAQRVAQALGPGYRATEETGSRGSYRIWLFKASPTSTASG